MNYSKFINDLTNCEIENSYLLTGSEQYLIDKALEKLISLYIEPSFEAMNLTRIDGKELNLEELISSCETLPFMSEKRIIILYNIREFLDNIKASLDEFYNYMDNLGDFICLIFLDRDHEIKRNMKIYKYFKNKKKLVDCQKLQGNYLENWIDKILEENQRSMTKANKTYFIQKSSYNSRNINIGLFELENELKKLIDYSETREIRRTDIDKVLIDSIDTNIFNLLDAITSLDTRRALNEFSNIYMENEPIQKIFYMISRQVRLIFTYKLYQNKGYSPNMIQKKMGIHRFEFKKIQGQSNNFSIDRLSRIMYELLDMDIKLKTTSNNDKLLMEMFIVNLCKIA